MEEYEITGYSERKFFAVVDAENLKEAKKKALNGEWRDEETESETFSNIEAEKMENKNKEKSPENQYIDEMNKERKSNIKKVNLDVEFDKWRDIHEEEIISRWEAIKEDKFKDFIEELWQEYQDENGL